MCEMHECASKWVSTFGMRVWQMHRTLCHCPIFVPTHNFDEYECAACGERVFKAFSLVCASEVREWWTTRIKMSSPDVNEDTVVPKSIFMLLHLLWHCCKLHANHDFDIVALLAGGRAPALVSDLVELLYCTHAPKLSDVSEQMRIMLAQLE
jgi:hypothetical protein